MNALTKGANIGVKAMDYRKGDCCIGFEIFVVYYRIWFCVNYYNNKS